MLTQYRMEMTADKPFRAGWGYFMYAALLEEVPREYGARLHEDAVTPVSQYFYRNEKRQLIWTVNLLGEDSESMLSPVLEQEDSWQIRRDEAKLSVVRREVRRISDVEELLDQAAEFQGPHRLRICTPAAFKQNGDYVYLPDSRLIIQNLLKKWNGCITDYPIEDMDEDERGMEALEQGLKIRHFEIHDKRYPLKTVPGGGIPGFAGTMTLENRLTGFHRQVVDMLLLFSDFAGLGIKTALGMGGIRHEDEITVKK